MNNALRIVVLLAGGLCAMALGERSPVSPATLANASSVSATVWMECGKEIAVRVGEQPEACGGYAVMIDTPSDNGAAGYFVNVTVFNDWSEPMGKSCRLTTAGSGKTVFEAPIPGGVLEVFLAGGSGNTARLRSRKVKKTSARDCKTD